jgi:hypothetical protein
MTIGGGTGKTTVALRAMSDEEKTLTYEVLDSTLGKWLVGYTGTLRLTQPDEGGCDMYYYLKTTAKDHLEGIYSRFLNHRVPFTKKMFAK